MRRMGSEKLVHLATYADTDSGRYSYVYYKATPNESVVSRTDVLKMCRMRKGGLLITYLLNSVKFQLSSFPQPNAGNKLLQHAGVTKSSNH